MRSSGTVCVRAGERERGASFFSQITPTFHFFNFYFKKHLHPKAFFQSLHYVIVLQETASYPDNWDALPERLCLNPKAVLGYALSPVAACDLNANEEHCPSCLTSQRLKGLSEVSKLSGRLWYAYTQPTTRSLLPVPQWAKSISCSTVITLHFKQKKKKIHILRVLFLLGLVSYSNSLERSTPPSGQVGMKTDLHEP